MDRNNSHQKITEIVQNAFQNGIFADTLSVSSLASIAMHFIPPAFAASRAYAAASRHAFFRPPSVFSPLLRFYEPPPRAAAAMVSFAAASAAATPQRQPPPAPRSSAKAAASPPPAAASACCAYVPQLRDIASFRAFASYRRQPMIFDLLHAKNISISH